MAERKIQENNEKIMAEAFIKEETSENTLQADENENLSAVENSDISLTSTTGGEDNGIELPSLENFEMHNAFVGNEYVSPVSGSLTYKKTLFTMKGIGGFDLPITISYNSTDANTSYHDYSHPYKIAQGWYFCFDGIIYNLHSIPPLTGNAAFKFADGSSYRIINNNAGIYLSRYDKEDIDINFERVIYANGVKETFNPSGAVTQITDRFGNGYIFEYVSNKISKIKSIYDENDCINFVWNGYTSLTIEYGYYRFVINFKDNKVSSVTDADGFTTSFNYTQYSGEYYYYIYNQQYSMYLPQMAFYYPLTSIIYPTGGRREYTYVVRGIRGSNEANYVVQKAELYDDNMLIDTVTYAYQGDTYTPTDIIKINDFEGYPLTYVDRSSQVDDGKTITYYNFNDRGGKIAEETYIKGSSVPYRKVLYKGLYNGVLPSEIITGYYNGEQWKTETESCKFEKYHNLVKSKTDKAGRVTTYTYDTPDNINGGYCLLKSESYGGITKTNTLSSDNKKVLSTKTVSSDKTTETVYTYDETIPCNIINEKTRVNTTLVSDINYNYDSNPKISGAHTILNVSSALSENPYDYNKIYKSYSYDILGRMCFTAEGGKYTHYAYDCSGRLRNITIENNSISTMYYNNFLTHRYIVREDDFVDTGRRLKNKYCFDSLGRMTKEIKMLNLDNEEYNEYTVNEYEYTGKNLTKVKSGLGSYTVYTYDVFDRAVSMWVYNSSHVLQYTKTVTYDDYNKTKTIVMDTVFEKLYFDVLGRTTKVEKGYIENNVYKVTLTTTYTYDNFDRVLTTTVTGDNRTLTTTNVYSPSGNLLSVTDPMGNKTEYTYNEWDKVATVKYPNNSVYTYTYDTLGRLVKETDPNNKSVITLYDEYSRVVKKIDKMGHTFNFTYDMLGNVLEDGNGTTYTYHADSSIKTMTDITGTTTYNYNINGQLSKKTNHRGKLSFLYYDNGLLKMMRDYDGARITRNYDDFGRLKSIIRTVFNEDGTSYSPTPVKYTYNGLGQVTVAQYPKGKTEYTYDIQHRLVKETFYTGVRNSSVAPTQVYEIRYSYDAFGNIIEKRSINSQSDKVNWYEYDNLFRLTRQLSYFLPETSPVWHDVYTYDCMGNRLTRRHSGTENAGVEAGDWVINYTYNNVNQLITETKTQNSETLYSYTYTYDDNGNMTNDPKTGNVIHYDYYFNKPSSIWDTTYTYNGKGELSHKNKFWDNGFDVNHYGWDENGNIINQYNDYSTQENEEGYETRNYGNIVGINGVIARYSEDGEEILMKDAHGNVIYTQKDLDVIKFYDYDAFGNEIDPDLNDTNPYRYCGEFYDVNSNMYYLRNRYYNPRIGRFTSTDPVKDGHNWYVYCGNNPVNFVDPFGTEYGQLREFVYNYASAFRNNIDFTYGDNFVIVSMGDFERAFYYDGTIVEWVHNGLTYDKRVVKIGDNKDGSLYMQRSDFLNAMGFVKNGYANISSREIYVNTQLSLLDLSTYVEDAFSTYDDTKTNLKEINVNSEFRGSIGGLLGLNQMFKSLANGEILSEGRYIAERIVFKKPNSNISYITDTLYGNDRNTNYYQYHTGVKIKYF